MRRLSDDRKSAIIDCINRFYDENGSVPTVREIAEGTELPATTVHRYLTLMSQNGEMEYANCRRGAATQRTRMEREHYAMPVVGFVSCGPGQEEQEQVVEYIRMPEALVGKGEFFALIAKGESMVDAGIHPGDYVIVKKQNTAEVGQLVVALYDGLNNLKKLAWEGEKYILRSCNPDSEQYPDIHVTDLEIQGIAVGVYHGL